MAVNTATRVQSAALGAVAIDAERCKGCALCVAACPRGVLALSKQLNSKGYSPAEARQPERCTGCVLCALMCPDVALTVFRRKGVTRDG